MSSFNVGLGVSDLRNAYRAFCLHDAIRKVVFLGAEIPGPSNPSPFKFQKGDVVECVEEDPRCFLRVGYQYEVADVEDSGVGGEQIVFLRNGRGYTRGFRGWRFKLISRPGAQKTCTDDGDCCDEAETIDRVWTVLCTGTLSECSADGSVADCCEEVKEDDTQEFTIEVGKKYLDRLGRRWLVVWDDGDEGWPLIAVREDNPLEIEWLSEDGRVYGEDNEADEDLVNLCCS
jgi:hypothetical protein